MPELAELKITSDYINKVSEDKVFNDIKKNPIHKGFDISIKNPFTIHSKSRGKELMLCLSCADRTRCLSMTMGMSGHFRMTPTGEEVKHSHLMFHSTDNQTLSFVDARRFGKWKWTEDSEWSSNRGPDPVDEYTKFIDNINNSIHKKVFNKPICEILLNQKYFSGIGNYLRSEILFRIPGLNPFTSANEAIKTYPEILQLCHDIPLKAYLLNGGQLKDWKNPFDKDDKDLVKFIRCYGNRNMNKTKDKTGRTFWYDPKWKKI